MRKQTHATRAARRHASSIARRTFIAVATLAIGATAATARPVAPPSATFRANGLTQQNLAVRYGDGYPQYRIAAFAVTKQGTLIAAYDARPSMSDLPSHIAVAIRRSTDGGATWGPQQIVRQAPAPAGFGDPSLLVDRRTGRIFLFYAAAMRQGYIGSHTGANPHDPDILQAEYSYSDDDGVTWRWRNITRQVKNPAWGGLFAASGEGIQLRQGPYAGRLIQQYVIRIGAHNYAASLYSDDDGRTWKMGRPVGPGMNENKSVGLADGDVLMDVRASPKRLFALSRDGGESYSRPYPVAALTDPGDNGSIIRYAPAAPASDPRAHWLLESNTDDPDIRRNLVVRMSCDDGRTWPIMRTVDPGSAAYSTLARLPHGRIGLFYERDGYRALTYTSFTLRWLHGVCAPLAASAPSIVAGARETLRVRVTNQTGQRLPAGTLTLQAPHGWSAAPVAVAPIPPGDIGIVHLAYRASTTHTGAVPLTLDYSVGDRHSRLQLIASVRPDPNASAAPGLAILPVLDHLTAGGPPGLLGDTATYVTRVTNTGNVTLHDVTLSGNMDHLAKCGRATLASGAAYVCWYGTHRISSADAQRRRYVPALTATATDAQGTRITIAARGEAIDVPAR
ncbi:MAG TPA: sialidase family protein [Rhodanobacteraceae bacterium]